MKRSRILASMLAFTCTSFINSAEILHGDVDNQTTSFSFPIKTYAFFAPKSFLFVGADQAVAQNSFAVASATNAGGATFVPLAPSTVVLDGLKNSPNPLHGAKIKHLTLLDSRPIVVKEGQEGTLYAITHYDNLANISVRSAPDVRDAQGLSGARIVGITTDSPAHELESIENGATVIAAVTNAAGVFGAPGSGIALAPLLPGVFMYANAQTGLMGGNKAIPLDVNSPQVKIGSSAIAFNNSIVDMHWDQALGRFYIALQVQGGAAANDGAKGVVIGLFVGNKLQLRSIVADAAVTADSIVGAVGANAEVSIHKVRTMYTSTWLHYLIVNGGVGSSAATKNKVHAMPLISRSYSSLDTGFLANKNFMPHDKFSKGESQKFLTREVTDYATAPGDLYISSDLPALVGGGDAPGDVTSMFVRGDAVFISVENGAGAQQQAGIFYSQPIFDAEGRIARWTVWQRVGGFATKTFGAALDAVTGGLWYLTGDSENTVQTVYRTTWQTPECGLGKMIHDAFPEDLGGVRGLFDFPLQSRGLTSLVGQRQSLIVASGYQKIVVAQTGQDDSLGYFGPQIDFANSFVSPDGTLNGFASGVSSLVISGGSLNELGPIIGSTIASDGTDNWLVVASARGVSILANNDGTGWVGGLLKGFNGLSPAMRFRTIGTFESVRRVFADGEYLYVLTLHGLYRIQATPSNFALDAPFNVVLLAQPQDVPGGGVFFDFVATDALGIIGTSQGMVRTGNGRDIRSATGPEDVLWTAVELPESAGGAHRFHVVSPFADRPYSLQSSNLLVLNSSVTDIRTRLYRFVVDLSSGVHDATIRIFPDYYVKNLKTFFLNVGDYRNGFAYDGSSLFFTRSAYVGVSPFLELIKQGTRSGFTRPLLGGHKVLEPKSFNSLDRMLRISGSGSWAVTGDFGITINQ